MMCTIVIRDVVGMLIFDIMALLVRGAVTFGCNVSAWKIRAIKILCKHTHKHFKIKKIYTNSNLLMTTYGIVVHVLKTLLCTIRQLSIIHLSKIRAKVLNRLIK